MTVRFDLGAKPHLGYTGSVVERAADLRQDPTAIATLEADARARTFVICGEFVIARKGAPFNDPTFSLGQASAFAPKREQVFLGRSGDAALFAVAIDPDAAEPLRSRSDLLVTDLRSLALGALVAPEYLPPLAAAKSLLGWHRRHRFCSNCGAPTRLVHAGWRRDCAACGAEHFPRTDPCVIMLAIDGERCLLGRQSRFPPGMWSCLAGFVEPGETFEEAVRREMFEEAGIRTGRVSYYASQPWPFPMSVMIGFHAEAETTKLAIDHNELEGARWIERAEIAEMLLRRHPERIFTPPPVAIAHHLIRAFVEKGAKVFG